MWVPVARTIKTEAWCVIIVCVMAIVIVEISALSGPNVCMVKQKYNITKRVKYRAPMSVRTYEWCFSMPPRCSKWSTEMRDLTRLETEERIAEVAVCCPGYKMKDVSCVPICTNGKTGPGCTEDCPPNKWGPNCINTCKKCKNGFCSRLTGECECVAGWQGESCDASIPPMTTSPPLEESLITLTTKTTTTSMAPKTTITTSSTVTTPTLIITTENTPETSSTMFLLPKTPVTYPIETVPTITTTKPIPIVTTVMVPIVASSSTTASTTEDPQIITTTDIADDTTPQESIPLVYTSTIPKLTKIINNTTFITSTSTTIPNTEEVTKKSLHIPYKSNETEIATTTEMITAVKEVPTISVQKLPKEVIAVTEVSSTTMVSKLAKETLYNETFKTETTTTKLFPSTSKIQPKEIWIRPAQKGESPIADAKIKVAHEFPRYRSANNKELMSAITTPKTIIVSIIPTSVSYSTFKRIALTSSYLANKNTTNAPSYNITDHKLTTIPMSVETEKPLMKFNTIDKKEVISTKAFVRNATVQLSAFVTPNVSSTKSVTKPTDVIIKLFQINVTNSMIVYNTSTIRPVTEISSETVSTRNNLHINRISGSFNTSVQLSTERTTKQFVKQITLKPANVTVVINTTNTPTVVESDIKTANVTKNLTKLTTDGPIDDEEFHILTEPEHITAVMGDKGTDKSSVDLISVISIAGGIMMAVITVAVIIVMIERCKKPRYEDIRKINDIRMQVMIDNSEVPPPYVRSIFHTPLPEPPTSDRCHYQPISTLDRNLKQFMRPVVVQTISPIMLENFRGILECHYDHLPRRSHDFEVMQMRSSLAPSMKNHSELQQLRASMTESTIDALKCEAKLDMIDTTTSEPLYAEIPCWRPPSEHAVEILNLNGEAVTEL